MTYLTENSEIEMPTTYLAYWLESDFDWVSYEELLMEYGVLDWAEVDEIYLFQNMNLMEGKKLYPGNADLISVSVGFNFRKGWIEIQGFTYIKPWWPGCELYETGEYLGAVEYSSRLKELIVGKFYELSYEREELGMGTEPELLFEEDYEKPDYGFDDYRDRIDDDESRFDFFAEGGQKHE